MKYSHLKTETFNYGTSCTTNLFAPWTKVSQESLYLPKTVQGI